MINRACYIIINVIFKCLNVDVFADQLQCAYFVVRLDFQFVYEIFVVGLATGDFFDGIFLDTVPIIIVGIGEIIYCVALAICGYKFADIEVCQ